MPVPFVAAALQRGDGDLRRCTVPVRDMGVKRAQHVKPYVKSNKNDAEARGGVASGDAVRHPEEQGRARNAVAAQDAKAERQVLRGKQRSQDDVGAEPKRETYAETSRSPTTTPPC